MKTKLFFSIILFSIVSLLHAQPVNDLMSGAIPITPSASGTGCATATFNLPFSTDGTTDSGVQGTCRATDGSGLDQFFTWTSTTNGLYFSSENPGNPGIVIWDSTGTNQIDCFDTFETGNLTGWTIGDNLIIQIYDFAGTALVDVAFCLEAVSFTPPPPVPVTFTSQPSGASGDYLIGTFDMNNDFLDDLVSISATNINIRQQLGVGGFVTRNITTTTADNLPSWSLAAADYDRNGYTDLLYGGGSGVTIMKANVDGTAFEEISGPEYVFSQRSNFADINNDGHLDAFVCHDVEPNVYFLNDGSGNLTFHQTTSASAPFNLGDYPSGGNYGSIWIDYDNDRDLDMFIAKCGGETARHINQMHTRDAVANTFTENASAIGLADAIQTWSSAWGDFDNDGDMDVFVGASSGTHKLMQNNSGIFSEVSAVTSGINALSANSREHVTFDFDNDGNLDIVSGNNILFGNGDMTFALYSGIFPASGSYGDLNNDGFIDAFNSGNIYMNDGVPGNNWVTINTIGVDSNINGIGARVEVHTPSGIHVRDVRSGDGFEFMNSLNTYIGIGTETVIDNIIIYWPDNDNIDNIENPAINTVHNIVEGQSLSVSDPELNDLSIYPNPVKDEINITTSASLTDRIATIFDINGKTVYNTKMGDTNALNVSTLQSGIYFLRIESNGMSVRRKFIKE